MPTAPIFPKQTGVQCVQGRLLEISLHEPDVSEETITAFRADFATSVKRALQGANKRLVVCADLRGVNVVAPRLTEVIVQVMQSDNSHLERSGNLLSPGATIGLQLDRIMRQSPSPNRRRFEDPGLLVAWLSECLIAEEIVRLRAFLQLES